MGSIYSDYIYQILEDGHLQMPELNGLEATAAIHILEAEVRRGIRAWLDLHSSGITQSLGEFQSSR